MAADVGSIVTGIFSAAGTIVSGALQANATSEANFTAAQNYKQAIAYQKERDATTDAQWAKAFGVQKRSADANIASQRWTQRETDRATRIAQVQSIGSTLSKLGATDPTLTSNLWNLWSAARRSQ